MKIPYRSSSVLITALVAAAGSAYAQQPPDVVNSDGYGNTAMGTDALLILTPSYSGNYYGYYNTAAGYRTLYSNNTGSYNTASGYQALYSNTSGVSNTASGYEALYSNTSGYFNTASGYLALESNSTGNYNTASGVAALGDNTMGSYNTAFGIAALNLNQTGGFNTAIGADALYDNGGNNNTASGYEALYSNFGNNNTATGYEALAGGEVASRSRFTANGSNNTGIGAYALYSYSSGSDDTASGYAALFANTTGVNNTAAGHEALYSNTTGSSNTATGTNALFANTTGDDNSATGGGALVQNTTGNYNVAEGNHAGGDLTTGNNNVAVGYDAGHQLTTGSYNIDIGNPGVAADGVAANSGVIRIGTQVPAPLQTKTYIAGIYNVPLSGNAVVVSSSGQLGVVVSSERFKTAIEPMGSDTAKLVKLRPVSFKLKSDATGTRQYGLIAEEVATVYPELVIRDQAGRIDGVRYDELAPMLLNEVQQQQSKIAAQSETIATQGAQMRTMQERLTALEGLNRATQIVLRKLQAKGEFVAQR